jgi:hypothetical protein
MEKEAMGDEKNKGGREVAHSESLPPPMIRDNGQAVAGFYRLVQLEPKRIGFAVIDAADRLQSETIAPVPQDDKVSVARLREEAKNFLAKGRWREMQTPDWADFDGNRDSLYWKPLNLAVTVTHEGNLWFSHADSGKVLGNTPFVWNLLEARGCSVHMMYHNLVFNDIAGFDPKTRLAFLAFDVVAGDRESPYFAPFKCHPTALVHVVKVDLSTDQAPQQ